MFDRKRRSSADTPSSDPHERLARLYREHSASVYRCARLHVGAQDAEDVLCEVFVVAWRRLPEIPEWELPWLLRVTRNVTANRVRALRRQHQLVDKVTGSRDLEAHADHADEIAALAEVQWAIAQLPPKDREVLRLLVVEHMTIPELAKVLGCRPNTASARAMRARQRLARLYATGETKPAGADPGAASADPVPVPA